MPFLRLREPSSSEKSYGSVGEERDEQYSGQGEENICHSIYLSIDYVCAILYRGKQPILGEGVLQPRLGEEGDKDDKGEGQDLPCSHNILSPVIPPIEVIRLWTSLWSIISYI
jgi:hypothetical protein